MSADRALDRAAPIASASEPTSKRSDRDLRHHACGTGRSSRGSRSRSRTSCGSPSSSTTSASTTSRRAGRAPTRRTTSCSGARRPSCSSRRARSSRSAPPAASRARSTATTRSGTSSKRTSAPSASSASPGTTTSSKRSARRSTKGSRWCATPSSSCAARVWTCCSTPSTSSTATRATRSSRCACSKARCEAGAFRLVLCDTNGGALPHDVERVVAEVVAYFGSDVGVAVHLHDDGGTGVANALAGVRGGAVQVQGTINGYGERTGNCNLTTIIPNLTLKMGIETIPRDRLDRLTPVAHHIAELVNMPLNAQAPYVGHSAFAHKAGLHTSAIAKRPDAYEHVAARCRRQRHALRRLGAGRAVDARAEGQGARARARRSATLRGRRTAQAARARGVPLRGRRRLARAADAPHRRAGGPTGSTSSRSASSPTIAAASTRSPARRRRR